MFVFWEADIDGRVDVTRNGRTGATLLFDGETFHILEGEVPESAIREVMKYLRGWQTNGRWATSV